MPVGVTANVPMSAYPLSAPGARVRADAGLGFVQAAVFDGDPGSEDYNDTGFRVRLKGVEGTLTVVETGMYTDGVTGLPGTVKVGAYYHSGEFPELDGSGTERRNYGAYAVVDQTVYSEEGPGEGLGVFARASVAPSDRSFVSSYFDLGLHYTGLFPGRDEDRVGLGLSYASLSHHFIDAQPDPSDWDREVVIELTYRAKLTKWFHLQPSIQSVLHPGGTTALDDALVLGLRFEVAF